jgi:16S rRNA (cytosine967-C5)-methyltransferase
VVLDLWQRTRIDWTYASEQLSNEFRKQRQLGSADRRTVAETLYGMIRFLRRLDFALDRGGRLADSDRDRARLFAYLVLEAEIDPEVASREVPGIDWTAVAGADDAIAAIGDERERLGLTASLPDWIAGRLLARWGDSALELATSLNRRAPMTVRVNTLRTSADELVTALAADGFATARGRHAGSALHFETRTNLFALPAFRTGQFEAQDEGSQLIAELVAPNPKAKVVDYCAGAGGKTLALAALMGNRGRLIATDVAHRELAELRRRARRAGVDNVAAVTLSDDPREPHPKPVEAWRGRADRVLIDAPCSGLGALRRNPEIRWRLQESDLVSLPALQLEIAERALDLVAPGGRLIYATCSVLPEENEHVAGELRRRHPELIVMSPREVWGGERGEPLCDPSGEYMELLPHRHGTDGFFAAVLRRPR